MKIVGIGETVLDIVLRDGQAQAAVPGGSTFNAMISLGRTIGREHPEVPLLMVTQTGDDAVSQLVLSFMEANGIRPDGVVRSPGQSTLSLAMLDSRGNARYEFFRDKELPAFQAPDLRFEAGDFVLFGSFFAISPETREQARLLVRRAREAGATVYYDINFRKNHNAADSLPQIEENMALSTIVRGSSEDIEALYGTDDAAKVYEEHIAPLCANFICTRGARETEVFSPGVHLHFPVPQDTKVISTIGAGDNFNAGTLYALAKALAPRPALTAADWERIVPIAHAFSANVVASLYNYVDPGFQP